MLTNSAQISLQARQRHRIPKVSTAYLQIATFQEGRDFFGPIADDERLWRGERCFNALLGSPRSKLGIGEHDRAEAYIFGNGLFPHADAEAHKRHLPVSVKSVTIEELFIGPHQTVDLSAHAGEFPWAMDTSEIYLHVTINKLFLSNQSKLVVKGNVFVLNCKHAIAYNMAGGHATIELGSQPAVQPHLVHPSFATADAQRNGAAGAHGQSLTVESTPLGLRIMPGSQDNEGQAGSDGTNGDQGFSGLKGNMLFLSDLRFGTFDGFNTGSIKIKARAGAGLPGRAGGNGGNGGSGGNGASGRVTAFGVAAGCRGGSGGNGGNGGNGGRGGNGGLTCDIFLSVPHQMSSLFQIETSQAPGGSGGDAGQAGNAGMPGSNGNFYNEQRAAGGQNGSPGRPGPAGKTRPAPAVHIYERP